VLLFKVCNVKVTVEKRFTIQQHISRDKDINGVQQIEEQEKNMYNLQKLIGEQQGRHAFVIYCNKELFLFFNI
jgi:hypothetical protein